MILFPAIDLFEGKAVRLYKGRYEDMTVYTIYEAAPAGLLGDVDCDGSVGFGDISALYLHLLGSGNVTAQGLLNADFDQDGSVGFGDISAIYLYLLGA